MKKGLRTGNRLLSWLLAVAMVITMLPVSAANVKAETTEDSNSDSGNNVTLVVDQSPKLEVALAVGNTKQNYATFEADLKTALEGKGIKGDNISFIEVDANASTSQESFPWWKYDHSGSVSSISDTNHTYIEKYSYSTYSPTYNLDGSEKSSGSGYNPCDTQTYHIASNTSGTQMTFYGYGAPAYKDFYYLPNTQQTRKSIEFTIYEGVAYDALDGIGFLVNTSISGAYNSNQYINGYLVFFQYTGNPAVGSSIKLFQLTNVNAKSLHNTDSGVFSSISTINGTSTTFSGTVKLIATNSNYGNYKNRKLKMEVMPDGLKIWYKGNANTITSALTDSNLITWTTASGSTTKVPLEAGYEADGKTFRGGFGPLISYKSHACGKPTQFTLSNLKMEADYVRSLTEVVREPSWSEDKLSFLVNLNEDDIKDFSEDYTTSEIINRLEQEKVTYIGWCGSANKDGSQVFVDGISEGSGLVNMNDATMIASGKQYYDRESYLLQVDAIADLIVKKVGKQITTGGVYTYLDTDDFHFTSTGATLNDGNWSVGYSNTSFSDAKNSVSNYADLASAPFTLPGYYEVYYGGDNETPKAKIRIHQAPKALFSASVSENGAIVVTNASYDPDVKKNGDGATGSAEDGITSSKIEYRNMTDPEGWTTSAPESIADGQVWMVRLTVKDADGASDILVQQISKQSAGSGEGSGGATAEKKAPYNAFALSKTQYIKNIDEYVEVYDQSYTLDGEAFTVSYVLKNSVGTEVANSTSATFMPKQTNKYALSDLNAGTYTLSMTATSASGKESESVSRTFSVKEGYKVTYDDGEGSGAPATQYKISGENLTLSSIAPARSGYIFAGWATEADGEATYQPGAIYTENKALDLYAVWKKPFVYQAKDYTGVYDGDGHNISVTVTEPDTMEGVTIYYLAKNANDSSVVTESQITDTSVSLEDVGSYKVYYKIVKDGYLTVSGSRTVEITKADPVSVTLSNKSYTNSPISSPCTVDAAVVMGVDGNKVQDGTLEYKYYLDKACTIETTTQDGASGTGEAPQKKGTYYVKAFLKNHKNYKDAESNVACLCVLPDVYYYNAKGEKTYGTLEDVLAATDNPKKRIYIESSMELNSDVTIPEGYTLFIDSVATLTIPEGVTLNNNGTIRNSGTIDGDGKLINNKTFDGGQVKDIEFVNSDSGNVTYTEFDSQTPVTNKGTLNDCTGGQVTNEGNGLVKTDNKVVVYKVSFDVKANLDDKTLAENPEDQSINCGDKIVDEPQITDIEEVAKFQGWYLDQACSVGKKWDFANDTVNSDITLYAKWEEFSTYEAYWVDEDEKKHFGTFEEVLEQIKAEGNHAASLHIQNTVTTDKNITIPDGIPVIIDTDAELKLKPGTTFDAPGGIENNGKISSAEGEGNPPVIKCGTGSKTGIENNGNMTGIKAESDVKNNNGATITNSVITGDLDNSGTVTKSEAKGNVTNHESGTLADTTVDAQKLKNEGQYTEGGNAVTHTVTYNVTPASGDGITITCPESDTVVFGGMASFKRPIVTPEDTDLVFSGWYKDENYTEGNEWNFVKDVVTDDENLYTKLQSKAVFDAYWIDSDGNLTYGTLTDALASESTMVTIRKDITLPDSIEIPENMTVVVNEDLTITIPDGGTVKLEGTLLNNGTIDNGGIIEGTGQLTNKKSINGGTVKTDVVNDGKINEATLSGPVTNNGQIVSSELSNEVTNNGTIYDSKLTEESHVTNNKNISGCDIQGEVENEGDGKIIDNNFSEVSYEVTFNLNGHGGDNTPEKKTIVCGKKIEEPARILDQDYYLTGWYLDQACTESKKWNFATNTVSKTITLYAGWKLKTSYEACWKNKDGETEYGTLLEAAQAAEAAKDTENKVSEIYVQNDASVSESVTLPEGTKLVVQSGVTVTVEAGGEMDVPGGIENNGTIKAGAETGEKPQITGPVENRKDASIQGCDITGDVDNSGKISDGTINGDVTNNGEITDTAIKADEVMNSGNITGGSIAGKEDGTNAEVINNESGALSGVDVTGDVTNDGTVSDGTNITGDVENNGTVSGGTTINGKTTNGENGSITGSNLNGDVENNGDITDTTIKADNVTNNGDITGGSIAGKTEDKANVTNSGNLNNSDLSGADVDNTNGTMTGEEGAEITHTVTFDLNGHENATPTPQVQTVEYGKKATRPVDPQDDEYTMTGWYLEDAGCAEESKWDFASNTVKTNITLYAKWELRSGYEAYWITQDGETRYGTLAEALASGSSDVTIQKNVTLPNGVEIPEGMTVTIPDKVVVTIPEGTTVTVNGKLDNAGTIYNDGEIAGSGTVNNEKAIYGGSIKAAAINSGKIDGTDITGPVTNSGRITDSTLTNTVVNTEDGAITDSIMSGDVTNNGMISGGELTETSHVTNNKNISGCDIKGNVVNTDSGKIVDSSLDGIKYTVTFTRNGCGEDVPGENVPDAQIIDCGRYVTEPDAIKDTDYVFIGWYKEAECQNKWNFNTDTVNGDVPLYAGWRAKNDYEAYWVDVTGEFVYGTLAEVLENAIAAGCSEVHVQENTTVSQPLTIPAGVQVTVDADVVVTFTEGGSLNVEGGLVNHGTLESQVAGDAVQITGPVTNAADGKIQNCNLQSDVINEGSVSDSKISGNVTNTGDIAGTTVTGNTENHGIIRDSVLNGTLNNASGGELNTSTVNGNVENAGTISGGSVNADTVHNSGEISSATITAATVNNDGEISDVSIAGKDETGATVTNGANGVISVTQVTGNVTNDGTITNGSTISGTTTNNGTIKDSTLNGTVDNKGTLENSDFEGAEVDNTEGTVIEGDNDQTLSYMVSFNTGSYGEAPQSQTVEYGKKATCPLDPVDETYAFAGWYQDEACTQPFDFNVTVIKKPTTIYGKWVSKSETEAYWTVGNETKYGTLKEALASGSKDVHITKKLEIAEDITIPEGVTVTVESGVTVSVSQDKKVTVAKDAQLINNGIVKNNGTIAGDGTVINNKNITGGTVDTDITNNGTVNSVELNGQVTNNKAINDCEINAGLDNQNGTVSKDGDQIVYTDTQLKGTVVKETGDMQQTQANATVKLMQGNKVIQQVKTAADGTYDLSEVPSGIYNLVIESAEGNTNTLLVQVNGNAIQMKEIKLPEGNLNNSVVVEEGAPDVVVGGLDLILTEDVATQDTEGITQADKEVVQNGGSIEVSFVTKQLDKIPADELDMEKVIDEDNKTPGMNLDLSVLKSVKEAQGDVEETRLTDLKNPIMVNIPIDKELQGKKNYIVYRFHDGEVDRITENADDGEYIEVQEGGTAITLYAKKFSTYVLAYEKEKTPDTDKPGENPTQPGQKPDAGNNGNETGQNPADGSDSQKDPYQNLTDEQKAMAQTLAAQLQLTAEQAVELVQFAQANGIETDTLLVTENTILAQAKDADIKGASFARIQAWSSKEKTNAVSLKWNKVKGADGYLIYGNQCGKKIKYITTLTGRKTSFTQKKLQKGTYYKYVVCAYKQIGDKKVTIALSKTIHSTTKGGKYGVAKSVKVNKSTVSIKQGKTFRLKAKEVKKDKKIKQHRAIVFESSNPAVATVSKKGVIKGVQKGRCYVYAYAQNGVYKRIKISVK